MSEYPKLRMRRLRRSPAMRGLVREASIKKEGLILPYFVCPGEDVRSPIGAMPGVYHLSVDRLTEDLAETVALGVPAVLLFGIPRKKDEHGSEAYADDGTVQQTVRAVKNKYPELVVMTDVCLCQYTSHGHCGILKGQVLDNDASLEVLCKVALSHAGAGADVVAPSDMMDGRIGAIRQALDGEGFTDVAIMAYSAKFHSSFYGPFREAVHSAPSFGDRSTYQMPYANAREALRELELDAREGADILMVKPALAYLDVIRMARERFDHPLAAYNVSGEYAMVKAAAERGWLDEADCRREIATAIFRAGADMLITYWAKEFAREAK